MLRARVLSSLSEEVQIESLKSRCTLKLNRPWSLCGDGTESLTRCFRTGVTIAVTHQCGLWNLNPRQCTAASKSSRNWLRAWPTQHQIRWCNNSQFQPGARKLVFLRLAATMRFQIHVHHFHHRAHTSCQILETHRRWLKFTVMKVNLKSFNQSGTQYAYKITITNQRYCSNERECTLDYNVRERKEQNDLRQYFRKTNTKKQEETTCLILNDCYESVVLVSPLHSLKCCRSLQAQSSSPNQVGPSPMLQLGLKLLHP